MFDSEGNAVAIAPPSRSSIRVLKDSTNRLPSIPQDTQKNLRLKSKLPSRSSFYKDGEDRHQLSTKESNTAQSQRPRNLHRQSSTSSILSRSSSIQSESHDESSVTIEEIRTSSKGTKTIHKYIRGRMLGKVCEVEINILHFISTYLNKSRIMFRNLGWFRKSVSMYLS